MLTSPSTDYPGSNSHLLLVSFGFSFPGFGKERRPGGEELLELGVRVLLAAVAAAGGASPGHFERRRFAGLVAGLLFHHGYGDNPKRNPTSRKFKLD